MRATYPRSLMEKAVEVMRASIAEPRSDGKASPKVGAVLLKSDGKVETAYRGELRHGDHAEYTLLERKNRDSKLDGSVLFATLEPCAPNARREPKLGCAERIVLARIREVWIGIEDPDPKVDRKGIKFLQDNGVEVHMFDRDLQEVIRSENKQFIEQALERAAAAKVEGPPEIILSPLESTADHAQIEDLLPAALQEFRARAGIGEPVDSHQFRSRLMRLGLLREEDRGRFVPTGFGALLFGAEPRTTMPQAGLLGTIRYPSGKEEVHDFDGPQVLVPEEVLKWLRDKLPNVIDRSQARRSEKNDVFFELVREGVVNALVHRDYGIAGAKCQLVVSTDSVQVRSPGAPVSPITVAQMQSFDAPMLSRNPVIHYVFAKMELAEERGLGLKSMKEKAQAAGLPLPRYAWADPYLVLTLFPTAPALPPQIRDLSAKEQAGWQWLITKGRARSADYAVAIDVDSRTARRHLNRFVDLGLVRSIGSGPATAYEVV